MAPPCRVIAMAMTAVSAIVLVQANSGFLSDEAQSADDDVPARLLDTLPTVTVPNISSPTERAYPDTTTPGCEIGKGCTSGEMPAERGLCVKVGLTEECWDVCNVDHAPQEYKAGTPGQDPSAVMNSALAGMVASVREGLNSYVTCPSSLAVGDVCRPGNVCSEEMHRQSNIPQGQGMCAVNPSGGHVCWDICNFRHELDDFTTGTAAGVGDKVQAARGNCPADNWWLPWLLGVVGVSVLLCCIAGVVSQVLKSRKKRGLGSSSTSSRLEAPPEMNQEFLDGQGGEQQFDDYQRDPQDYGHQQQDYGQDQGYQHGQDQGYQQDYRADSRDMRMQEPQIYPPQEPVQMQMQMQQDMLPPPPEPPRQDMQPFTEPPIPDRRSHDSFNNRGFSPSQSYNQQFDFGAQPALQGPGSPGPGSMRVNGLTEPHLFPSVQPLVVPQTNAQMAPPDLLSQALPMPGQPNMFLNQGDPLGMSQSRGVAGFRPPSSGQSFPNTFNTQLPTTFQTNPPTSGLGYGQSMQLNPQQGFFTQLRR